MPSSLPLILVSPHVERKGDEFGDTSTTLSASYQNALMGSGGLPLILPLTDSRELIAECVSRCDGVLLTGGDDVEPTLHTKNVPARLRKTVQAVFDGRDARELMLINEVFRQRKPLLAICRGQQILNVALGGTLVVDIPAQLPDAMKHNRMDRRNEPVHEVRLTPDSLLAKITGRNRLKVNSTHHQAVAKVAAPLRVTAQAEDGVIEGLELKPETAQWLPFLLSVQFHPERLAAQHPEHRKIFNAFTRVCALSRE